jgi:metal-responsive CopG/Arc/MetJ family transcriptional regulator
MKEKTSITLSSEVLASVDRHAGAKTSRSAFIESVLRAYFKEKARQALHKRDMELINANAEALGAEAMDVLRYQAPIDYSLDE